MVTSSGTSKKIRHSNIPPVFISQCASNAILGLIVDSQYLPLTTCFSLALISLQDTAAFPGWIPVELEFRDKLGLCFRIKLRIKRLNFDFWFWLLTLAFDFLCWVWLLFWTLILNSCDFHSKLVFEFDWLWAFPSLVLSDWQERIVGSSDCPISTHLVLCIIWNNICQD